MKLQTYDTFINYENQAKIAQLHDSMLSFQRQPVRAGFAKRNANQYLADETAIHDAIECPVDDIEEEYKKAE